MGVLQCLGNRIVETGAGRFRGAAASDGGYAEFLGIPYGQISAENPFGVSIYTCKYFFINHLNYNKKISMY